MKIAMFGPSGGGKTTLTKIIPTLVPVTYIPGSVYTHLLSYNQKEELASKYGYIGTGHQAVINLSSINPAFGGDFQKFALMQRRKLIENNNNFVTDRSPIDNLTYFHLQCSHNQTEKATEDFIRYTQELYQELTHAIFVRTVNPQGIEDNDSRVANIHYQRMVDSVFEFLFKRYFQDLPVKTLVLDTWDLQGRVKKLSSFLQV
jgi:hypothetical protein